MRSLKHIKLSPHVLVAIIVIAAFGVAMLSVFLPFSAVFGALMMGGVLVLAVYSLPAALFLATILAMVIPDGAGSYQYFSFVLSGYHIRALEVIFLALLVMTVVQLVRHKLSIRFSWLAVLLLAFLAWVGITSMLGLREGALITDLVNDIRAQLYYLGFFIALAVFGEEWRAEERADELLRSLMFGAIVFSCFFFVFYSARSVLIHTFGLEFPDFGNRFNFRNTSIFFLPLAVAASSFLFRKKEGDRALALLAVAVIAGATIISGTRTLWIAAACTVLFCLILAMFHRYLKAKIVLGGALLLLIAGGIASQFSFVHDSEIYFELRKRVETFEDLSNDSSFRFRVAVSEQTLNAILTKPIVGFGQGILVPIEHGDEFTKIPYIDNSWLTLGYKAGGIGVLLFAAMWIVFLVHLIQLFRWQKDTWKYYFLFPVVIAMPALFFFSLSTVMLLQYQMILVLAVMMGAVEALYLRERAFHVVAH